MSATKTKAGIYRKNHLAAQAPCQEADLTNVVSRATPSNLNAELNHAYPTEKDAEETPGHRHVTHDDHCQDRQEARREAQLVGQEVRDQA